MHHLKQALRYTNYILATVCLVVLFSCNRLKRKGNEVVDKTQAKISQAKQKISDKKHQLTDKIFSTSDNSNPDSEKNKKRFKEYLQVDLTDDVKNIYTYGDFLGADYKVLIAFSCDTATLNRIISVKAMKLSDTANDEGLHFGEEFTWWNKVAISNIRPYKIGKEYEYWKYLWFDKKTKTAYYEEFSL